MSLKGKVAIVTGATKGVGRGIGRELARHGARVFVTGRSAPDHERLDEYFPLSEGDDAGGNFYVRSGARQTKPFDR